MKSQNENNYPKKLVKYRYYWLWKRKQDKYLASTAELLILIWVYFSESPSMWFLHDTFCPHLIHINCLNKIQDNNIKILFNVIRFETSGFCSNTNLVPQNEDYFDYLYFCFRMLVQTFRFLSFTDQRFSNFCTHSLHPPI